MIYPIEEKYILATEETLKVKFPMSYRKRMLACNGGDVYFSAIKLSEEQLAECIASPNFEDVIESFSLFHFLDDSSVERKKKTFADIIYRNNAIRKYQDIPQNFIVFADNSEGDLLLFLNERDQLQLDNSIYLWRIYENNLVKIADDFSKLIKFTEKVASIKKEINLTSYTDRVFFTDAWPEMEKINEFPQDYFFQLQIRKPWNLFKIIPDISTSIHTYFLIFGKKQPNLSFQECLVQVNPYSLPRNSDELIKYFHECKNYYRAEEITDSFIKEPVMLGNKAFQTFLLKSYTSMYIWLYNPSIQWHLQMKSSIARYRNDFNELKKLFDKDHL